MGRYALIIVMALSFAILLFGQGNRTVRFASGQTVIETHAIQQSKNIAQSAALYLIRELTDDDNDDLIPQANQSISVPQSAGIFLDWAIMEGAYRYRIINQDDSLVILTTVGRYGEQTYTLEAWFDYETATWDPDLSKAVFSNAGIELEGSARIRGHAGTNATSFQSVKLAWSTKIDSSLVIGPGGNISTTVQQSNFQQGNVGLEIGNVPAPVNYPLPEFPDFPSKTLLGHELIVTGGTDPPMLTPADYDGYFIPTLRILGNRTVTIFVGDTDRTLHVGNLDVQQGHINIIGNGQLTIYAEDNITLGGSSTINNTRTSDKMFTYYKGTNAINFGGSTTWRGGMYAETANIHIGGSGGITGNIITGGSSVTVTGNAEAHSRVIYAPNAHVELSGSGRVRGAVVAGHFKATGATYVQFTDNFNDSFPDFSGDGRTLTFKFWR